MDSVFFVPDKIGNGNLVNLFKSYNKFNTKDIVVIFEDFKVKRFLDSYDMKNLRESGQYLLNSIDNSIYDQIDPYLTPESIGPEIWMRIIGEIQSFSSDRLLTVIEKIKPIKLF